MSLNSRQRSRARFRWSPVLVAVVLLTVAIGCRDAASNPTSSGGARKTSSTGPEAAPPEDTVPDSPPQMLDCSQAISEAAKPGDFDEVLFDGIALPTRSPLQANPTPDGRVFAKHGLVVREGFEADLVVPPAWRDELTIGWGSPGEDVSELRIPGCTAPNSSTGWLAFSGGYQLAEPACIELVVRTATRAETVQIGIGASCPGQGPPPRPTP